MSDLSWHDGFAESGKQQLPKTICHIDKCISCGKFLMKLRNRTERRKCLGCICGVAQCKHPQRTPR